MENNKDKKRILIVEDDDSIRKILGYHLEKNGFDVFYAVDGEDGLIKAKKGNVDIIILDLMLPKKKGEEVCKEIRKDERVSSIPIIMLTAKDRDIDRIIGRVIGADSYMGKPFDINELLKEINRLIGLKNS